MDRRLVYLAGPLYTPPQRKYLEDLRDDIKSLDFENVEVFVPHHHIGMADEEVSGPRIFEENIKHLDDADIVIAVLHGFDVDAGTAFEVGYAFRQGTPVFGISEDARIPEDVPDDDSAINLMISNAVTLAGSTDELSREIRKAYREDNGDTG